VPDSELRWFASCVCDEDALQATVTTDFRLFVVNF